ncbi:MAG: PH domain-containing protein, partial [Chthoniobacterales bacterium]
GIPFTKNGLSAIGLIIPLVWAPIRWFTNRATTYELTTQRFRITRGILNRQLDEIELYRVKDYVMTQPLFLRLLGLGNIDLLSSDVSTPTVTMRAIAGVEDVREKLRTAVQSERDRKRVRALDVDNTDEPSALG